MRENRSICPVVSFCSTDCKSLWLGIESVPFPLVRVGLICVCSRLDLVTAEIPENRFMFRNFHVL